MCYEKNTFDFNGNITFQNQKFAREVIIREIISCTNDNVAIVGSTGMILKIMQIDKQRKKTNK